MKTQSVHTGSAGLWFVVTSCSKSLLNRTSCPGCAARVCLLIPVWNSPSVEASRKMSGKSGVKRVRQEWLCWTDNGCRVSENGKSNPESVSGAQDSILVCLSLHLTGICSTYNSVDKLCHSLGIHLVFDRERMWICFPAVCLPKMLTLFRCLKNSRSCTSTVNMWLCVFIENMLSNYC